MLKIAAAEKFWINFFFGARDLASEKPWQGWKILTELEYGNGEWEELFHHHPLDAMLVDDCNRTWAIRG